jgi:hypothetical protein
VPGAGKLQADAQGWVVVHRARTSRRHGRAKVSVNATTASLKRTFASASMPARAGEGELLTLTLKLAPSYRSLASAHGGLSATVDLTFTAAGHPALRQSLAVTFVIVAHRKSKRPSRGHTGSTRRKDAR